MGRYDSAWKDIIEAHFREFTEFYFPDVAAEIDFGRPIGFLDKELSKLSPHGTGPGRVADVLARVYSYGGFETLLYCHVEVQGKKDPDFARRLFQVGYRIFDRFSSLPVTLVILTDSDPEWDPSVYEVTGTGRSWRVEFQVTKLIYYEERRDDLRLSGNPFAFVTEALLEETEYRRRRRSGRPKRLFELKKRLVTRLLQRGGYSEEYIQSLVRFLDWMLQLPEKYEKRLGKDIEKESGGTIVSYVTSWERRGERKGIQKGIEKGREEGRLADKQEVLIRFLSRKFVLDDHEQELILSCDDSEALDAALDTVIEAETKDEVLQKLY